MGTGSAAGDVEVKVTAKGSAKASATGIPIELETCGSPQSEMVLLMIGLGSQRALGADGFPADLALRTRMGA